MKGTVTNLVLLLCVISFRLMSQNIDDNNAETGGPYQLQTNDAAHPCVSAEQYAFVERKCAENIKLLGLNTGIHRSTQSTLLSWPLKAADGFNDCGFYYISAYVDQNKTAGAIQDWNCGTNTYDTHQGTDIAITPFPFYKMDNNQVQVIAAAPGTILYKSDGHFDKNCAGNSDTANYIVIQHSDGTQAHYWHMKKNSLTNKIVGQTVATGEFLGVVGSSGSSSGPHLHFEVWSGSTASTLNDPFAGTCNTLNANSWWTAQKPYTEPAVIKASVNTTDIVLPACPATETPNESTSFSIPFQGPGLNPGYAKFYIFIRNETVGMTADLSILNPDGSTYLSWTHNSTTAYNVGYWSWSKRLPVTAGTYTFKAVYNGLTCTQTFDITTATGLNNINNAGICNIYPNPSKGNFIVESLDENNGSSGRFIEVYNVLGERIYASELAQQKTEVGLNTGSGIYFYKIQRLNEVLATGKLVIE